MLAHPDGATVLGPRMSWYLVCSSLLTHIPDSQLLIARSGDHQVSVSAPGEGLDDILVLQCEVGLAAFHIPDLDGVVARRGRKDVLGCRVEEDLSDLPGVTSELADWGHSGWVFGGAVKAEAFWNLPNEDLAVVGSGCNDAVVERVPIATVSSVLTA